MSITHDDFAIILSCVAIALSALSVAINIHTERTLNKIKRLREDNNA